MNKRYQFLVILLAVLTISLFAQKKEVPTKEKELVTSSTVSALKFRSIGPALTSGRIADFAVNPKNFSEYYIAVASGNVWKTVNNGTTFTPIFDNYGAYAIGCVVLDPNNHNVVWVGTGENNHQRALGYGDGVYKSVDGGQSWKNMGLKESRQIGGIAIDPRNSDIVYVAAEGSVWGSGGERGLYKSTDGGNSWAKVLNISENTGVNNIIFDPRNPDVLYATSEQRRRHFFTKIGGGPESAVYKSTDAGKNWYKIEKGLPSVDKGGMGIAISPVNPDVLYLIVEAAENQGGFYRSTNRGESWQKMSSHHSSGQYYNRIFCDPQNVDKVYSVETVTHFTVDGGKTFTPLGLSNRHVDDHALWINPNDTKHILIGGDGGIYESFDEGENWNYKSNLSVTQFYRVSVDNATPFYNVYGGTQDNNSMYGPSQTLSSDGIVNYDWVITNGGDGFWSTADPIDHNIVYAESQYGGMVRYDKRSGESISIRPEPRKGELNYKWNWDTPLFVSSHKNTRIFCAANKVFRSNDRGDHWEVISDDLTAQVDRNSFPVMGKYWPAEAVAKDVSTSLYGTLVSLTESSLNENLLYAGSDDGVISVTENAKDWVKYNKFPGIPEYAYVSDILADKFNMDVVYATFNNLKNDDFKPYVLKSTDKGKSWKSISGNLPLNGTVHTIEQDFINPNLLFVGTEFGCFFTLDGGNKWIQLKSGLPTIAVRDIAIQKRENDLAIATFGRGFYIIDNYSPLREIAKEILEKDVHIFKIKDALLFNRSGGRYGQGETYFKAPNPEFGATFTYYIKDAVKTQKQIRKEKDKELFKESKKIPIPSFLELRKEDNEIKPHLLFVIKDQDGNFVRKISESIKSGINRLNWDLRYTSLSPLKTNKFDPIRSTPAGHFVLPGKYSVTIYKFVDNEYTQLGEPATFNINQLENSTLPASNNKELVEFLNKVNELNRIIRGADELRKELVIKLENIRQAIHINPTLNHTLMIKANELAKELDMIEYKMNGQTPKASREENEPAVVTIMERLNKLVSIHRRSTSNITGNEKLNYQLLNEEFPTIYNRLKEINSKEIKELENELEKMKAPHTQGRIL